MNTPLARIERIIFAELQVQMDMERVGGTPMWLIDSAAQKWTTSDLDVGIDMTDYEYLVQRLNARLCGSPYDMLDIPDGSV